MDKIDAPLDHELLPPVTRHPHHPTLVLLHGRGASGHDLLPLVPELGRDDLLAIAPHGPLRLEGAMAGGAAWYHLQAIGAPEPTSYADSLQSLDAFLSAIVKGYPVDPQRLFLLGFSQGSVMALSLGRRAPDRIAGIVALSGYLADPPAGSETGSLAQMPVFVGHGDRDEIFPLHVGHETRDGLSAHGATVTYHEYPAGHAITPAELADVQAWLEAQLGAAP